jgi:hypothetical protein
VHVRQLLGAVPQPQQVVVEPEVDGLLVGAARPPVTAPARPDVELPLLGAGERAVEVDRLLLLHVPVAPVVGDEDGDRDPVRSLDVVALEPERVVVGRVVVAVLRVDELVAGSDRRANPVGPVRAAHVERRRDGQAEVEGERRVDAFVGRVLVVEEVADAARERVLVPARDAGLRHDRRQVRRSRDRGRRGCGAVVGAADHPHAARRPRLGGDPLDEVVAALLLADAAVVPAAARVARADDVAPDAGVAARHVARGVAVAAEDRVGREREDRRRADRVPGLVDGADDLEVDVAVPGRHDVGLALRRVGRAAGRATRRDQDSGASRCDQESNAGPPYHL